MNKSEIELIVLIDYNRTLYSVWDHNAGIDKERFLRYLKNEGIRVSYKMFYEINFRDSIDKSVFYLYQSSEDVNLKYKSFIEDIVFGLELKGANLIPPYKFLKAHHNKVFMEILRDLYATEDAGNINSKYFGTYEELVAYVANNKVVFPIVFKTASSCGSRNVFLAHNKEDLLNQAKKSSFSPSYLSLRQHVMRKIRPATKIIKTILGVSKQNVLPVTIVPRSNHREKFILQNLIPGLKGDYKVLVFYNKLFVLERWNRPDGFTASGSGIFEHPADINNEIQNFCIRMRRLLDVPFISLDIALNNNKIYLLEFQFIMFGTFTLERSNFCFTWNGKSWNKVEESPDLEREYALSIAKYIKEKAIDVPTI